MTNNKFGEMIFSENDLCDLIMQGRDVLAMRNVTVVSTLDIERMARNIEDPSNLLTWTFPANEDRAIPEFDHIRQGRWFMPDEYKNFDIAEYLLGLCQTQEQLQRVGKELMMYQDRDLMDLLRYLKYLVDVMKENRVIWGVGRGSSVASYVLYLLGVHQIDSMFYDLDPHEFLR